MNNQLILKFPSQQAYKKEDFYVSPSNQEAYDFIIVGQHGLRELLIFLVHPAQENHT